ncbi:MAG TPA: membrane dipeptidase, partial [Gemmatimonadales bacterium]|nr:membrane dipeptidase [Gemmatimonadales bacterium]
NGGIVMVTFVPAFVSAGAAVIDRRRMAYTAEVQRTVADTGDRRRALEAWDAANPEPRATLAQVADHVDHVRRIAGVEHVGIGSDFDGIERVPLGLEDVSHFPDLFAELARRGWTDDDLRKLAGWNLLRVLRQTEATAARLQRERGPSSKSIDELDRTR